MPAVRPKGDALAGIAGLAVWALAAAAGLAGAASREGRIVAGAPTASEWALAAAAAGALAGAAGLARGGLGLGLAAPLALVALGASLPGVAALTGGPLLAIAVAVALAMIAAAPAEWARRAFVPAIVALHLAAAAAAQIQVGPQGDEPHYLMVARSLLRDGDLALDADYAASGYREFHPEALEPHYRVRGKDGAVYSLHAVGLSILILPAYALGGYPAASFFLALLGAAAAWQVRALARDVLGDGPAADAAGWIAAASPPLLHFAGLVFTEVPAALAVTVALRAAVAPPAARRALAGGALLAALPWLNVRYAILSAIVAAAALLARPAWRVAAAWLVPSIASALAIAAYHHWIYGFFDPRRVYGRRPEFALSVIPTGLPGLFLDQEFGLFAYAPVFALAVPGLLWLARRQPRIALAAAGLIAAVVAVASPWPMWRGGFNPPARFLLPVLPALALGAAAWLRRGPTFPAALLVAWGLWTGMAGTLDRGLVHRDRDGTAPLFRARSGALEWTTLLPGFVLDESARDRAALAAIWTLALAAAASARRPPTAAGVAIGCGGLALACAAAASVSTTGSEGRDAVRVLDRTAVVLPAGPIVRGEARWAPAWAPLYEPHRHPDGAVLGARLDLPAGEFALDLVGEPIPSDGPSPALVVRDDRGATLSTTLGGRFALPSRTTATLALQGGSPLMAHEIRLRRSTISAGPGPTP